MSGRKAKKQAKTVAVEHKDERKSGGSGVKSEPAAERKDAVKLECVVCVEHFNTDERRPRLLACAHSLCSVCCVRLPVKDKQIE
jgi:hypothetical protein